MGAPALVRRRFLAPLLLAAVLSACAGGGGRGTTPAPRQRFTVPAAIAFAVPPAPPRWIPAKPSSLRGGAVPAVVQHPAFFAGEAALSNGVYYLAFPNGTPFGYYSYLSDPSYVYHFDMGYEYAIDANDGNGGIYFYDFASGHWWYTGRTFPFPYVYDFSLRSLLYYYPDQNDSTHYTTNPRYFFLFSTNKIVTMPGSAPQAAPQIAPSLVQITALASPATVTVSENGYTGTFTVAAASCAGIASIAPRAGSYTVAGIAPGVCAMSFTDTYAQVVNLPVSVTTSDIVAK